MRYSTEIKKFLYSQYFYGGLRIAFGVSLPAVLMLLIFHDRDIGFTISTGALAACNVDIPGPLKYKRNEMLACSFIGFAAALITGIATAHTVGLWLTVTPLTFCLSMLVVYGFKWPQISFAALFIMATTLGKHLNPHEALMNAIWILAGGLWYTYWSTLVSYLQALRLEQQAIATSVFATAEYLRARANFYELDNDLGECYRTLIEKQVIAVDLQEAARDIVLRNLPKRKMGFDVQRTMRFNLFINIVDLHETVVAAHTDYALMRETFADADVMLFFRDLIRKIALDLENIGLALLQNHALSTRFRTKAELRAIEYEIESMRRKHFADKQPEAYAALVATCRRVWSVSRLIEKMRSNTCPPAHTDPPEVKIDQMLQNFLKHQHVPITQIFSNLTLASPSFRHALRMTIVVSIGLFLGKVLPLTNAYWICITSIVILKPGFSLTRQRNFHRLIGTAIGCVITVIFITLVKSSYTMLLVMFICMVMSYSLLLFYYPASVVFTSSYVLILYHLLAPTDMQLIGERVLDTVIGGIIATTVSHLFPYWEYRVMKPLVKNVIHSTRQYFETVRHLTHQKNNFSYRLARKAMHIAFANLGNAFSRMMREPKSQQKCVAELNDLLIQSHVLAAQITAAAPLIISTDTAENCEPALSQALAMIDENLAHAEAAMQTPPSFEATSSSNPAQTHETTKAIIHALDLMVVEAEKTEIDSSQASRAQELKLLAHQCKQMMATSKLVAKDACAIRLPTA